MISNKRLTRWLVMSVAIMVGMAFIILAIKTLDYPQQELVMQLVGIAIFFILLIVLAGVTAAAIRWVVRKKDASISREEQAD